MAGAATRHRAHYGSDVEFAPKYLLAPGSENRQLAVNYTHGKDSDLCKARHEHESFSLVGGTREAERFGEVSYYLRAVIE